VIVSLAESIEVRIIEMTAANDSNGMINPFEKYDGSILMMVSTLERTLSSLFEHNFC
jgi:hypothetical protein